MTLCLVIVASEEVRLEACRIVKRMGFLSTKAEDGYYAYTADQGLTFDLIILDLHHASNQGEKLFQRIQSLEKSGRRPIFCCTSDEDRKMIDRILMDDANDWIMTPLVFDDLVARLLPQRASCTEGANKVH